MSYTRLVPTFSIVLALTSCGVSETDTPARAMGSVVVDVSLDVCGDDTCMAAPVPGASVTIAGTATHETVVTDVGGRAEIDVNGSESWTLHASWEGLASDSVEVDVGSGAIEVSLRLLPAVRTQAER